MKKLQNVPTIGAPTSDYPKGFINPGVTKVSSDIYGDIVETMHKMVANANITENDVKDNVTNGHQMLQAIEYMAKSRKYYDVAELTVAADKTLALPVPFDISRVYSVANVGYLLQKITIAQTLPINNIFSVFIYFVDETRIEAGAGANNSIDIGNLDIYNIPALTLVEFTMDNSVADVWIPKILWSNSYSKDMIQRKIVVIPAWNMDSTTFLEVDHDLPETCLIVGCQATILSDAGAQFPLNAIASTGLIQGGVNSYNANPGKIAFERLTGGIFDSTDFNDTTGTRGYAVIDFISAK